MTYLIVRSGKNAEICSMIVNEQFKRPVSGKVYAYTDYLELVRECVEKATATGTDPTEERIAATKINYQRMTRIGKQWIPSEEIIQLIAQIKTPMEWWVIAESWCGDAAQNLPILAKMAELNPTIQLSVFLRDEHPELMDQFLTNGARSIPKLICIDPASNEVLDVWGARPSAIQKWVVEYKASHVGVSHEEFSKELHLFYAKDKGKSLEADMMRLIQRWI